MAGIVTAQLPHGVVPLGKTANTIDTLVALLLSLGIIIISTDDGINMPEIYLHGFGLKRKGGLRRSNN